MTTVSFKGIRADYDDGEGSDVIRTIDGSLTVPSISSTFRYQVLGEDDGIDIIEMDDDIIQPILDNINFDNLSSEVRSDETLITRVSWKSGGSTVLLIVSLETGDYTDTEFYIVLDGKPLPSISSAADWAAVEADIQGFSTPTGAFAPGADIAWADIPGATTTEEDEFYGTPGRDVYHGGAGDDYFVSSDGRDTYNGGAGGYDQVTFAGDPNGVTANLKTGKATDGWGNTDTLKSIEMLRGSAHDDKFVGNGKANYFRGLAGEDTLIGGGGRDQVRYDRDERHGGNDGVTVKLNKGFAIDGFGDRDTLKSIEYVRGSELRDNITGNGGRNKLEGEGGYDKLFGLGGNDTLFGGRGRDTLEGGGGDDRLLGEEDADRFVFNNGFGNDIIADFQTSGRKEKIDLDGVSTIRNFRDLKNNHLSENGDGDAVISDNRGNTITLEDISIADLSGNDFIF